MVADSEQLRAAHEHRLERYQGPHLRLGRDSVDSKAGNLGRKVGWWNEGAAIHGVEGRLCIDTGHGSGVWLKSME
jgi:hypothetical protein